MTPVKPSAGRLAVTAVTVAGAFGLATVPAHASEAPTTVPGGSARCATVRMVPDEVALSENEWCAALVSHSEKMARLMSWTLTSRASYGRWYYGLTNRRLFATYDFVWATDYCTASPDQPNGFDFRLSCHRHDFGYRNYRRLGGFQANKARVDQAFYADMLRKCRSYAKSAQPSCVSLANIYYEAVKRFGFLNVSDEVVKRHARWKAERRAETAGTRPPARQTASGADR